MMDGRSAAQRAGTGLRMRIVLVQGQTRPGTVTGVSARIPDTGRVSEHRTWTTLDLRYVNHYQAISNILRFVKGPHEVHNLSWIFEVIPFLKRVHTPSMHIIMCTIF